MMYMRGGFIGEDGVVWGDWRQIHIANPGLGQVATVDMALSYALNRVCDFDATDTLIQVGVYDSKSKDSILPIYVYDLRNGVSEWSKWNRDYWSQEVSGDKEVYTSRGVRKLRDIFPETNFEF